MKRLALAALVSVVAAPGGGRAESLALAPPPVVWIPSGHFTRGADFDDLRFALGLCIEAHLERGGELVCREEVFAEETPQRSVFLSSYGIDRTEVTQAAYDRCVAAGACAPPRLGAGDERVVGPSLPVAGVTFAEAATYCAFVGGRLPTEAEWERAARGDGPDARFPWGRFYNDRLANHGRIGERPDGIDGFRYAAPVGSFPAGKSPFGVLDAAGNVWEWTADRFQPGSYATDTAVDPKGPTSGGERLVRGGSWRTSALSLRVTHRVPVPEGAHSPDLGFRCAYSPTAAHP